MSSLVDLHAIGLKDKKSTTLEHAFDELISHCKSYGHTIFNIHCDHESTLEAYGVHLEAKGIQLSLIAPYQHEQRIERYVQTINNRVRSTLAGLRFVLPLQLYGELFVSVAAFMNALPNSIHSTLSPQIVFKGT